MDLVDHNPYGNGLQYVGFNQDQGEMHRFYVVVTDY